MMDSSKTGWSRRGIKQGAISLKNGGKCLEQLNVLF